MSPRITCAAAIAALTAACGAEPAPEPLAPEPAPAPLEAPPAASEEVTAYEIHEWGIVDVDLSSRQVELAAGPGRVTPTDPVPARPIPVRPTPPPPAPPLAPVSPIQRPPHNGVGSAPRKPVLYFHLRDASPSFRFDLTVSLGEGRVVEHWPGGERGEHTVRWSSVGLSREHCEGGPYPSAGDPSCAGVADGYCEVAELASYVADDAGCLDVGGQPRSMLFYRGDGASAALPITVERAGEALRVTNDRLARVVGEVLRLRTGADGVVRVALAPMPARGASVELPAPTEPANGAHRHAVREQLRALGLTPGEAGAFERAWFGELFDGSAPTPHAFGDAVLFFLPDGAADEYARLEASPPPAAIRRAMAIRAGWPR